MKLMNSVRDLNMVCKTLSHFKSPAQVKAFKRLQRGVNVVFFLQSPI
jgi:hypothetical protein